MNNRAFQWIILVVGIITIINLSRSLFDLLKKDEIIEKTNNNLEKVEQENKDLKEKLSEVQSKDYVEKQARDKLNLGKEGEVVLILPSVSPPPPKEEKKILANWEKWLALFKSTGND